MIWTGLTGWEEDKGRPDAEVQGAMLAEEHSAWGRISGGAESAMTYHGIDIPSEALAALCRRHHIRRLSLYGSILREDFGPQSDVDVLVEFEPGCVPGLLGMSGIEEELTAIVGRRVDLRTPAELSRHFREEVRREARAQYVAA